MIDLSLEMTGESKIGDTPWQELSPQLNKKLVLMAGLLKELSENPATREAVKEIAQAIAVTMIEIMKEINIPNYSNLIFVQKEIKELKKLFKRYQWPVVDVTRKSVEETAATIIKIFDIKKNQKK